ncbi:MAG: hypothetical protein ACYTFO_01070 [Planctomycetota bacterium]|jgi:hypothetical protein
MRIRYILIVLAALMVPVVTVDHAQAAETPVQAALDLRDAVIEGDQDAFVACFDAGEYQQRTLGAMFAFLMAQQALNEAVLGAFGEEGAAEFHGGESEDPFGEIAAITEDDLIVEVDGDEATIQKVGEEDDDPLHLVRTDGDWLIVFDEQDEPTSQEEIEEIEQGLQTVEAMTQVFNNVAEMADDEGMTPEALKEQMSMQMLSVMMSAAEEDETEVSDDEDWDDEDDE